MMLLDVAPVQTAEVIDACLSGSITGARLIDEKVVLAELDAIDDAVAELHAAVTSRTHRSLPRSVHSAAVQQAMIWLYEHRLKTVAALPIRDSVLALGASGCPYCHSPAAPTLDHSYPKSTYPRLAVTPFNLVPACRDCNAERNVGSGTVSVSPYVDDWVESASWLEAAVTDPERPFELTFAAGAPAGWNAEQHAAVAALFTETGMGRRFAVAATQELSSRSGRLLSLLRSGGPDALYDELDVERRIRARISPNYWGTAAYTAWLQSFAVVDWEQRLEERNRASGQVERLALPEKF